MARLAWHGMAPCRLSGTDLPLWKLPCVVQHHVELSVCRAVKHQPLPYRQSLLPRGHKKVVDLVSCGKGREQLGKQGGRGGRVVGWGAEREIVLQKS